MNFLHPAALIIGAALVVIPIAVHLLTRPRPVRFPFSAMKFLESALRQRRFFARLRDVLILLLRTALLVALAAAFARPFLKGGAMDAAEGVSRRVVILDVSASMGAHQGGVRVMERARAQALRYLKSADGMRANVVFAAARAEPAFDRFSSNFVALQEEIRRADARPEELDARAALAQAARLLTNEPSHAGTDQIIVVTDLQDANWKEVSGAALPSGAQLIIEYAGLDPAPGNLAITNVHPQTQSSRDTLEVRVEIANFSATQQGRTLELTAGGRLFRQDVTLPPWRTSAADFELPAQAAEDGWMTGSAKILEARDALPVDDQRCFAFPVKGPPRFALVTREETGRVGGAAYFLARMLDPGAPDRPSNVMRVAPESLEVNLPAADLIVLCQPGRLNESAVSVLASALQRGLPVLYLITDSADAANLDAMAQACAGQMMLPVRFAPTRTIMDASAPVTLASLRNAEPPFRAFGDEVDRSAREIKTTALLRSKAAPGGAPDEVLAAWSDGSAALIATHAGMGRLALWNGSLVESTCPRSAFFIALVQEVTEMLLTDPYGMGGALAVGTQRLVPLQVGPESLQGIELLGPDGARIEEFRIEERPSGLLWRWGRIGPPGVYRVHSGARTVLSVATACPSSESDLRATDSKSLETRLAGTSAGRSVALVGAPGGMSRGREIEIWPWLIVAALGAVVVELGVLKFFKM